MGRTRLNLGPNRQVVTARAKNDGRWRGKWVLLCVAFTLPIDTGELRVAVIQSEIFHDTEIVKI